ncbi:MAG TPA: tRNA lysidine(34) synthetase TilS [Allosphingosinicella sp.]
MTPPDADLVTRFRADLERLIGAPARIGVAVSGGPDSIALLLLAQAAYGDRVAAATVDHRLRSESAEEAHFVARICAELGCAHSILPVEVPQGGAGIQGEARRARYDALRAWAEAEMGEALCTAHHADDQAETLLMRLKRGAGLSGLAGIRPLRKEGKTLKIVRPLLGWRRRDLADVVTKAGIAAVDDPSNRDLRFDRAAMRQWLAAHPEFDPARLARSAAALLEAEEGLAWAADRTFAERARFEGGEWRIDVTGLPRALRRRLLAGAIADLHARHSLSPAWTGQEDVEGLLHSLEAGSQASLAGVLATGGAVWRVRPAPPRRPTGSRRAG